MSPGKLPSSLLSEINEVRKRYLGGKEGNGISGGRRGEYRDSNATGNSGTTYPRGVRWLRPEAFGATDPPSAPCLYSNRGMQGKLDNLLVGFSFSQSPCSLVFFFSSFLRSTESNGETTHAHKRLEYNVEATEIVSTVFHLDRVSFALQLIENTPTKAYQGRKLNKSISPVPAIELTKCPSTAAPATPKARIGPLLTSVPQGKTFQ